MRSTKLRDAAERLRDELLLLVGGHHDRDALAVDHTRSRGRRTRARCSASERRDGAEQEPDQAADEAPLRPLRAVTWRPRPARRRGSSPRSPRARAAAGPGEVLLDGAAPLLGEADRRVEVRAQEQPLGRAGGRCSRSTVCSCGRCRDAGVDLRELRLSVSICVAGSRSCGST